MDYSNKILVAAGCSHTYGQYMDDFDGDACYNRSWVKKLELTAGFKSSINLAHPGASNKRSIRVLTDFLLANINDLDQYVFMMGTTELSRSELPSHNRFQLGKDRYNKEPYYINLLYPMFMELALDEKIRNFLEMYFGMFNVDAYDRKMINHDMLRFHIFLNHYQVEHYFPVIVGDYLEFKKTIGNVTLPYIRFHGKDAINDLCDSGFKTGADVKPESKCYHYDHDAHEHIAKEVYKSMIAMNYHTGR